MRRRDVLKIFMTLLIAVLMIMPAKSALGFEPMDPDRDTSLTMVLKTPAPEDKVAAGAEVTIFKVAEVVKMSGAVGYKVTSDFASLGIDPDDTITQSMIDEAAAYAVDNGLSGVVEVSDGDGKVVFEGLESGLYLVTATKLPTGFTSFVPFMYYLPFYSKDAGAWVYDGTAEPKMEYLPPVDVSVRKVWNDDGKNRPSYVTVQLSNENGAYDTVRLDDSNDWKYTWTELDPLNKWEITEINVPADYKDTYSSDGYNFTITNTEKLVQTGQTNWPVPVLIFVGSFLVCAGVIIRVTGKRTDEEA